MPEGKTPDTTRTEETEAKTTAVEAGVEEYAAEAEMVAGEEEVVMVTVTVIDKVDTKIESTTKVDMEATMTLEEAAMRIEGHNPATKVVVEATASETSPPSLWLPCQPTQRKPNLKKRLSSPTNLK